eukprot:4695577-Prymnesium_polylepis.1
MLPCGNTEKNTVKGALLDPTTYVAEKKKKKKKNSFFFFWLRSEVLSQFSSDHQSVGAAAVGRAVCPDRAS